MGSIENILVLIFILPIFQFAHLVLNWLILALVWFFAYTFTQTTKLSLWDFYVPQTSALLKWSLWVSVLYALLSSDRFYICREKQEHL